MSQASRLARAILIVSGATIGLVSAASAADPAARKSRGEVFWQPSYGRTTTVMVDELFLGADNCPRNRACIAPRVMDVVHARGVTYRAIAIPVDPRIAAPR